ncbi:DASH complex subunit dam1 [Malassezia nana]|uniref:DASH complex subunit DAM1 n=1 Tax=Malassezia nana TaxID=180528 RepID=A0AAF0EMQ2_9BASI|nr:DASH complex subunit dam1 [Malassezia nana]
MATTPRRTSTPIRVLSGSMRTSHVGRSHPSVVTPLTFLEDEALPILAEETAALQANMADMADIHQALGTFNESFAAFLYGIKMNAFCVEWPEAPTEAHVQAWQTRPVGTSRTSAPAPVHSEPADDTYVTDVDVEERCARAPAPRPTQRPAARPAERPRASPASSLASSRTRAPRGQSAALSSSTTTRTRVPPAVLKRRTAFADDVIDTMPLEYRQGDPVRTHPLPQKQRLLVQHIILALLSAGETGIRGAYLALTQRRT